MTAPFFTRYPEAPSEIQTLFHAKSVTEITIGCSPSTVYRIQDGDEPLYLKIHPRSPHFSFAHEVSILHYLAGQLPVPCVRNFTTDMTNEYLVLSEVTGENCVDAMKRLDSDEIVRLSAQGLQQIHQLDITQCPFDERIEAKLERAQYRIHNALVDEDDFDDERFGMTAKAVYTALRDHQTAEDDLVFTHGDYCLPNIIIQGKNISGFIDLDRAGISDRYNDLSIASRSIVYNLGPEYEERFFKLYGIEHADKDKIEYYRMMDELF